MKHLFAAYIVFTASANCFSQGLINFNNTPSTLLYLFTGINTLPINGPVGTYEFALLSSPVGANNFSFAGVYGTNTTTAGIFSGGANVAVPGWAPGTARDFAVFGWNSGSGVIYNSSWLRSDLSLGSNYPQILGFSEIGTGIAGGVTSSGTVPTLDIFGGASGIQRGFLMSSPVPEPSSLALGGLGAVLLVLRILHRRGQYP